MKKEVDYEAADGYDWTLFTDEDRRQYRQILISMPYDPDLARFFHEQKQMLIREINQRRRCICEKTTAAFNQGRMEFQNADTVEEEYPEKRKELLREEIERLDPVPKRRIKAHFLEQRTYKAIAAEEGVSKAAVCGCVRLALEKIKEGIFGRDKK